MRCSAGVAKALTAVLLAAAPAVSQEVIELPGDDRALGGDFEEVFRIGSLACSTLHQRAFGCLPQYRHTAPRSPTAWPRLYSPSCVT